MTTATGSINLRFGGAGAMTARLVISQDDHTPRWTVPRDEELEARLNAQSRRIQPYAHDDIVRYAVDMSRRVGLEPEVTSFEQDPFPDIPEGADA